MCRLIACLLLAMLSAAGQPDARSHFDAASIKPSGQDSRAHMNITPGRLNIGKINLSRAIYIAYHLMPYDISGGPKWIDSDDFDIVAELNAKDVTPMPGDQRQQVLNALQVLLEERFHLTLRRETRIQPIYLLTVAKSGFKLRDGDTLPEGTGGGFGNGTTTRMVRRSVPLSDLVYSLSGLIGRHILDQTGLTGAYSYILQWSKEQPIATPGVPDVPAALPTGPATAISEALREQLGLNLEAGKGPVEVIVVERAEKPSAN